MQFEWTKCSERLPEKDGQYLVVYEYFGYLSIAVISFTTNLHDISPELPNKCGWFALSSEWGYYERSGITHWMELPKLP